MGTTNLARVLLLQLGKRTLTLLTTTHNDRSRPLNLLPSNPTPNNWSTRLARLGSNLKQLTTTSTITLPLTILQKNIKTVVKFMKVAKQKNRKQKVVDFFHFYRYANAQKDKFYNIKWRLLIGLLILIAFYQLSTYLPALYPATQANLITNAQSGTTTQASERMLNWFLTGFFAGFLAYALMTEGEFMLAIKNTKPLDAELNNAQKSLENAANEVEHDVEQAIGIKNKKQKRK